MLWKPLWSSDFICLKSYGRQSPTPMLLHVKSDCNLLVSEIFKIESVDARTHARTDGRRLDYHTISSPCELTKLKHQHIKQKEPPQKYRLGTISDTKLLAGLNRFYMAITSPSSSEVALIYTHINKQ